MFTRLTSGLKYLKMDVSESLNPSFQAWECALQSIENLLVRGRLALQNGQVKLGSMISQQLASQLPQLSAAWQTLTREFATANVNPQSYQTKQSKAESAY